MTDEKDTLWRTIAAELRTDILDGRYPPGAALPSEPELVRRYNVSRPTVRKAIDALVTEGLAYVIRGRGSFVRPDAERKIILITNQERPDLAAPGSHPDIINYGWDLAHQTWKRDADDPPYTSQRANADRNTARQLGIRTGYPVIHRTNTWAYPNGARILIDSWTNSDRIPDFDEPKRNSQYRKRAKFFYQTLQRAHGPVRWGTFTTARSAYDNERGPLGLDYADAILIIRRHMIGADGHSIEYTDVKVPANRFEIGYAGELADDINALFATDELAEEGIQFVI